jgi:hypothetical protein
MNEALDRWMAEQSPATLATAQAAIREYLDRLTPVIGAEAAFTFQVAFETCQAAMDRLSMLNATLAAQGRPIDDADVELLQQVQQEQNAAVEACDLAGKEIDARLAETFEPRKKGA